MIQPHSDPQVNFLRIHNDESDFKGHYDSA